MQNEKYAIKILMGCIILLVQLLNMNLIFGSVFKVADFCEGSILKPILLDEPLVLCSKSYDYSKQYLLYTKIILFLCLFFQYNHLDCLTDPVGSQYFIIIINFLFWFLILCSERKHYRKQIILTIFIKIKSHGFLH